MRNGSVRKCNVITLLTGLALASSSMSAAAEGILRDPTRPYTARVRQAVTAPRYIVDAIFVSARRSIAVVNGQRVRVGEKVGAATVIAIEKDHLVLMVNGKRLTATLAHGAIRR